MKIGSCASALTSLLLSTATFAHAAGLAPVSQDRRITGALAVEQFAWLPTSNPFFPDFAPPDFTNSIPNGPQELSASDFGPFSEIVTVTNLPSVIPLTAATNVTQTSELQGPIISASGSWSAMLDSGATLLPPPSPYNYGREGTAPTSESFFSFTFSLDAASSFQLNGDLVHDFVLSDFPFGYLEGSTSLLLEKAGGTVIADFAILCDFTEFCIGNPIAVDVEGVLAPGVYTLEVRTGGSGFAICEDIGGGVTCFTPSGGGSYDIELAITPTTVPGLSLASLLILAAALSGAGMRGLGWPQH